jgi:hypothetical protein
MNDNLLVTNGSIWLTSFWGWSPGTWGKVGFTKEARRRKILEMTSDPFLMVVYVTKTAPKAPEDIRGKVMGFYLVSHIEGHRNEFTHETHHEQSPNRWIYSIKALKAFTFLPDRRIGIDKLGFDLRRDGQNIASNALQLDEQRINILAKLPYVEVDVFDRAKFEEA